MRSARRYPRLSALPRRARRSAPVFVRARAVRAPREPWHMNRPNSNRRHAKKATTKKRVAQRRFDTVAGAGKKTATFPIVLPDGSFNLEGLDALLRAKG